MLREQTREHISKLGDAELLEYVLTGGRMYEPEAVGYAKAELDRRALPPEQIDSWRAAIAERLSDYDLRNPPTLIQRRAEGAIVCELCGVEAPNRYVTYRQNVGLILLRISRTYHGHFCRRCNHRFFRKSSLITFFLGWWGIQSFIMTLFYLTGNTAAFLRSFSIPPAARNSAPPQLDDSAMASIELHHQVVEDGLLKARDPVEMAREIAALASVTPGQAWRYVRDAFERKHAVTLNSQTGNLTWRSE